MGATVPAKDELAGSIHNTSALVAAITSRAREMTIAPDFTGWESGPQRPAATDYYHFVRKRGGVFRCTRVRHPGAEVLNHHVADQLCDLVLGGATIRFVLDPLQQSAVRFCELFLATVCCAETHRTLSHDGAAAELALRTDWSIRDGVGPTVLPVPCVVGYISGQRRDGTGASRPSTIWSCRWQLSQQILERVWRRIEKVWMPKPEIFGQSKLIKKKGGRRRPERRCFRALSDQRAHQVASGILVDLSHRCPEVVSAGELLELAAKVARQYKSRLRAYGRQQVAGVLALVREMMTASRIPGEILTLLRNVAIPSDTMYGQAAATFPLNSIHETDCWGHPIGFTLRFLQGLVEVTTLSSPRQPLAVPRHNLIFTTSPCVIQGQRRRGWIVKYDGADKKLSDTTFKLLLCYAVDAVTQRNGIDPREPILNGEGIPDSLFRSYAGAQKPAQMLKAALGLDNPDAGVILSLCTALQEKRYRLDEAIGVDTESLRTALDALGEDGAWLVSRLSKPS